MPFIGNQPALSYTSFAKQDFTTSATTSYTLSQPVANENEIALFINFVRQEPGTAYSASGTSLTLTSATSASDDMYAIFLGKAIQTVNPPVGSVGTAQISSSARATNLLYPAFRVVKTSDQTTTDNLITKITWDVEEYDTDNTFASNTFTVPSGQAGKYYIESSIFIEAVAGDGELSRTVAYIYKNGSIEVSTFLDFRNSPGRKISTIISSVLDLSAGDYIEIYGFGDTVSGGDVDIRGTTSLTETYFQGFRIGD